jgi:hypothetical protein
MNDALKLARDSLRANYMISENKKINTTDYFTLIAEHSEDYNYNKSNSDWLLDLFQSNGIDFVRFVAEFLVIKEKRLPKRNAFVLCGPPNSGKTMLLGFLTNILGPTIISKQGESSSFYYQKLLGAKLALMEEPTLGNHNCNTYKSLLGGEKYQTDVKNQTAMVIDRVPFIISTNEDTFAISCSHTDRHAIHIRCFIHKFKIPIINGYDIKTGFKKPPGTIHEEDLHHLILQNKTDIMDCISRITSAVK